MKILAVETSCDETSIAVLEASEKTKEVTILSNVVSSQVKLHAKWGGVVPNLAAREHVKNIVPVLDEALKESKTKLEEIDLFVATQGPGLIPALLIGTNAAKTLAFFQKKPLVGVHHIEAHILASFAKENESFEIAPSNFPALALVVSGGHTQLVSMEKPFQYEIIGQTQDDAVGEAFDKVAKMLDLGYPGGPIVSKMADEFESTSSTLAKGGDGGGSKFEIEFPRPMLSSQNFDFSFSGLKTSVLYRWKEIQKDETLSKEELENCKRAICHEFQEAAIEVLVKKTLKAAEKVNPKSVILAGGVAANKSLREKLEKATKEKLKDANFFVPPFVFCGDNAAMIGIAGYYRFLRFLENKKSDQVAELEENWKTLEADAGLELK